MTLADELALIPGRVRTGCARLDNFMGEEWVWKVNLQTLDEYDHTECVEGQLYGDYEAALRHLGFDYGNGYTHGFAIDNENDAYSDAGIETYFTALTTAWFRRIVDLRSQRLHLQ